MARWGTHWFDGSDLCSNRDWKWTDGPNGLDEKKESRATMWSYYYKKLSNPYENTHETPYSLPAKCMILSHQQTQCQIQNQTWVSQFFYFNENKLSKIASMMLVNIIALLWTRYVNGTPTSKVTPVTIRYIRPPYHGHINQYHGHEWMTHMTHMSEVNGQGHILYPVSNRCTSFSFLINQTNHSWDMAKIVFDLENLPKQKFPTQLLQNLISQ